MSGALTGSVQAQSTETGITGKPEVIDADILKFGTQRVILWGIDAPEKKQKCQLNGALWGCYDVSFRYPNSTSGIFDVSYVAEPGETVAIVGPTGSGKSTALALLQRARDPESGSITVGAEPCGREIKLDG